MGLNSKQVIVILLCGILSSGAFILAVVSQQSNPLPIFLPIFPIAFLGLGFSARHGLAAAFIACIVTLLMLDGSAMLLLGLFLLVPACHFIRKALLWRGEKDAPEWYPLLSPFADLAAMVAGVFMVSVLTLHYPDHSDLKTLVSHSLLDMFGGEVNLKDPNMAAFASVLMSDWVFVLLALVGWIWVLAIYGCIVAMNAFLRSQHMALRPSFAVEENGVPGWVLAIMSASMLLTFAGRGNDRFAGETVLLIMALPYFLSGLASVHRLSHRWEGRRFWLALVYAVLLFYPLAAVLVIAKGAHTQLETILKRWMVDNSH